MRSALGWYRLLSPPMNLGYPADRCGVYGNVIPRKGQGGIEHRNKGKPSNRSYVDSYKESILMQYEKRYHRYGADRVLQDPERPKGSKSITKPYVDGSWCEACGSGSARKTTEGGRTAGQEVSAIVLCILPYRVYGWARVSHFPGSICSAMTIRGSCSRRWIVRERSGPYATFVGLGYTIGIPLSLSCHNSFIMANKQESSLGQGLWGLGAPTAFAKACDNLGIEITPLNLKKSESIMHRLEGLLGELGIDSLEKEVLLTKCRGAGAVSLESSGWQCGSNLPWMLDGTDLRNIFCFRVDWEVCIKSKPGSENKRQLLISKKGMKRQKEKSHTDKVARWLYPFTFRWEGAFRSEHARGNCDHGRKQG